MNGDNCMSKREYLLNETKSALNTIAVNALEKLINSNLSGGNLENNFIEECLRPAFETSGFFEKSKLSGIDDYSFRQYILNQNKCYNKQYYPEKMGSTDLVLTPTKGVSNLAGLLNFNNCLIADGTTIGIEVKSFTNIHSKSYDYMNSNYFFTGNFSEGDGIYSDKGSFLQNKFITDCKEGQLLKDYSKAARVITNQNPNKMFILCGVMYHRINDTNTLHTAIKPNIDKIIGKLRNEKQMLIKGIPNCLTDEESALEFTSYVTPGKPGTIPEKNNNLMHYVYYVLIHESKSSYCK